MAYIWLTCKRIVNASETLSIINSVYIILFNTDGLGVIVQNP